MTPERFLHIRKLFDAAMNRPPESRVAFLKEACAGDNELLTEIESLLAYGERLGTFLEKLITSFARSAVVLRA